MKSVMKHQFSQVPTIKTERSSFDRSHGHKTAFDAGKLVPIFVDEVLPGDTFNMNMTGFARMATPIHPLMDNMYMDTHFFFVPTRILWDNWKKFNGEQTDPGDSTDFLLPQFTTNGTNNAAGTLSDYFGIPTAVSGLECTSLLHRAYALIWNEWFRDQNLQDSITISKGNGPDLAVSALLPRGKRHDYFTSCLPWPLKGDSINYPIGDTAPIYGDGNPVITNDGTNANSLYHQAGVGLPPVSGGTNVFNFLYMDKLVPDGSTGLYADLTATTAGTINQLRQAFQLQRLLEKDARGGTRYNEQIKSHFGVTVPDYRVQRPEYLGGGSSSVNISPVAQTSETTATSQTPQGNLSALGTAALRNHSFTKSFTEHGYVLGLCSVRADLTYQQGLERMWSRQTRYDFYQPTLAHIGEQAVLSKEIYANGDQFDEDVFGYQEAFAEYRYKPSRISGILRSNHALSLDAWHLSQEFSSRPILNDTFIEETPPIDRVIAVPDQPQFIFDSYFKLRCSRPMPIYAVPGMMDHF